MPFGGADDRRLLQPAHSGIDDLGWRRRWRSGLGAASACAALFRIKATTEEKDVAINLMQVVAAYVGIMVAFTGV
jgi:hypothetical protein